MLVSQVVEIPNWFVVEDPVAKFADLVQSIGDGAALPLVFEKPRKGLSVDFGPKVLFLASIKTGRPEAETLLCHDAGGGDRLPVGSESSSGIGNARKVFPIHQAWGVKPQF